MKIALGCADPSDSVPIRRGGSRYFLRLLCPHAAPAIGIYLLACKYRAVTPGIRRLGLPQNTIAAALRIRVLGIFLAVDLRAVMHIRQGDSLTICFVEFGLGKRSVSHHGGTCRRDGRHKCASGSSH